MNVPEKLLQAVVVAEKTLNSYFESFSVDDDSTVRSNFFLLRLQAAMIQFELCVGTAELLLTMPSTFARKVVLKNLIHKIFEYIETLTSHHRQQISRLAEMRGLTHQREKLRRMRPEFKLILSLFRKKYKDLRNNVSGHYSANISQQINLIFQIDEDESLADIQKFMKLNMHVLSILRNIGKNR